MSGESSAQGGPDVNMAPPEKRFQFQTVEYLNILTYDRPTHIQGGRLAVRFFHGDWEDDDDSSVKALSSPADSMPGPSCVSESRESRQVTSPPVQDVAMVDTKAVSTSAGLVPDTLTGPESFVQVGSETGHHSGTPPELTACREELSKCKQELIKCKEELANCQEGMKKCVTDLENATQNAKSADEQLETANQRLQLMRNQNLHSSQELAIAREVMCKSFRNTGIIPEIQAGWVPLLVHYDSSPLIKKRVVFNSEFKAPPKVILGIQTSDELAMPLVLASDIETDGFCLHADLANYNDYEENTDLLKISISYMAVEYFRAQAKKSPPGETNTTKRARH